MSRLVSIAANAGEVSMPNGVVLGPSKTSTVLTDGQWAQISGSSLVSGGTLIDGGATSQSPEQTGTSTAKESDPVAESDLGLLFAIATKTANYTLKDTDRTIISNGASLTHSLPAANTQKPGKEFRVKNIASTAVTVNISGGGNIDGGPTVSVAQWAAQRFITDGSSWYTA